MVRKGEGIGLDKAFRRVIWLSPVLPMIVRKGTCRATTSCNLIKSRIIVLCGTTIQIFIDGSTALLENGGRWFPIVKY